MYVTVMPVSADMALAFVFGFIQISWWSCATFYSYWVWSPSRFASVHVPLDSAIADTHSCRRACSNKALMLEWRVITLRTI